MCSRSLLLCAATLFHGAASASEPSVSSRLPPEVLRHYYLVRNLDIFTRAFVLRNGFPANGDQTKSGYSSFTDRPFTLEGNFLAMEALHEMLLQSWSPVVGPAPAADGGTAGGEPAAFGPIRLFPATPAAWRDAAFEGQALEAALPLARIEVTPLPPLAIAGQPARAHTQGLEIVAGAYYVTARREDVQPKRALLLRTAPGRSHWVVWDITPDTPAPAASSGENGLLDHPGGLQAGGGRLWIPVAESRRGGRTLIRAYAMNELDPDKPATPAFEFAVDDHIGALAVSTTPGLLVGASWDTERVYFWDLGGRHKRTLSGTALAAWDLGVAAGPEGHPGVAVQDWKIVGERLFGSGLRRAGNARATDSESWLLSIPPSFDTGANVGKALLPRPDGVGLAREGMAIADGMVHFLPEDLGATNRAFRIALNGLRL